jgi:hypothetical protein
MSKQRGPNNICCVNQITRILRRNHQTPEQGGRLLDLTITTMERAYEPDSDSSITRWHENLFHAISEIHGRNPDGVDMARLVQSLRKRTALAWNVAASNEVKWRNIGFTVVQDYNKRGHPPGGKLTW